MTQKMRPPARPCPPTASEALGALGWFFIIFRVFCTIQFHFCRPYARTVSIRQSHDVAEEWNQWSRCSGDAAYADKRAWGLVRQVAVKANSVGRSRAGIGFSMKTALPTKRDNSLFNQGRLACACWIINRWDSTLLMMAKPSSETSIRSTSPKRHRCTAKDSMNKQYLLVSFWPTLLFEDWIFWFPEPENFSLFVSFFLFS